MRKLSFSLPQPTLEIFELGRLIAAIASAVGLHLPLQLTNLHELLRAGARRAVQSCLQLRALLLQLVKLLLQLQSGFCEEEFRAHSAGRVHLISL